MKERESKKDPATLVPPRKGRVGRVPPRTIETANKTLLNATEVQRKFGISPSTLHRWRLNGLPCYKPSGPVLFLEEEVVAFVLAHRVG